MQRGQSRKGKRRNHRKPARRAFWSWIAAVFTITGLLVAAQRASTGQEDLTTNPGLRSERARRVMLDDATRAQRITGVEEMHVLVDRRLSAMAERKNEIMLGDEELAARQRGVSLRRVRLPRPPEVPPVIDIQELVAAVEATQDGVE